MRLEIEIEIDEGGHAAVHDRAGARVAVSIGVIGCGRVKAGVVSFPADEDAQGRVVLSVLSVDALECLEDLGKLFVHHFVILALLCVVASAARRFSLFGDTRTGNAPLRRHHETQSRVWEAFSSAGGRLAAALSSSLPAPRCPVTMAVVSAPWRKQTESATHLLPALLQAQTRGELYKVLVDAGNDTCD